MLRCHVRAGKPWSKVQAMQTLRYKSFLPLGKLEQSEAFSPAKPHKQKGNSHTRRHVIDIDFFPGGSWAALISSNDCIP